MLSEPDTRIKIYRLMIDAIAQNKVVLEITDHFISFLCCDCFDHKTSNTAPMADED